MRAYVSVTGAVFALITLAHVWRIMFEQRALATDPFFIVLTVATTALSGWAWSLLRNARHTTR